MPLEGRGSDYGFLRGVMEGLLARAFVGGWPALVAHALRLQPPPRTVEHAIEVREWPEASPALTVGFASDFHAGPTTHPSLFKSAADTLTAARLDVLVLGGDYVLFNARHVEVMTRALAAVPAPAGRFALLGNHDLWADDRRVTRALEDSGFEVLVNRAVTLPPPFAHVSVCGMDDPWTGAPDAERTFRDAAPVRIFAVHSPSGLALVGDRSFDLLLAGHTHGGQIALPGGRPILLPNGPFVREYPWGRHALPRHGGATLVVSRGVGMGEAPFRLFAPADVVVCRLRGPSAS